MTDAQVQEWRTETSQNLVAEKRGTSTMVPPAHNVASVEYPRALMWNKGRWTKCTSSAPRLSWVALIFAVQRALAWVSTTALGRDVVPDVYWIHAGANEAAGAGSMFRWSSTSDAKPSADAGGAPTGSPMASLDVTAT